MRWFVDISAIGSGGKASRFCVEAEQWQRALQSVRGLRGDTSPFANFSIELLDDGYRAIDPATRTRFVVQKAPDGADLITKPIEVQVAGSIPPPPLSKPAEVKGRASERQRRARTNASTPSPEPLSPEPAATPLQEAAKPNGVVPTRAPGPTPAAAPARPMQAATAFEKMTGGASTPLPKPLDAKTALLPRFTLVSERTQAPTESSPITYREIALAIAEGASDRDAEAIARAQFEAARSSMREAPAGQFINVAVFDHEFTGKPRRPPIATLAFKDWQKVDGADAEPILRFPLRGATTERSVPLPPDSITTVGPPPGTEDNPEEVDVDPDPTETPTVPIETHAPPASAKAPPVSVRTPVVEVAPEPVRDEAPVSEPAPEAIQLTRPAGQSFGARGVHPVVDVGAIAEPRPTSRPATSSSPRISTMSLTPSRRSSGENLIIELFEALSDLALLHDPLEGADLVLRAALDNMPSAVAMVSFFSFNSRDFVAVRAAGESVGPAVAQAIILKRITERSTIPTRAMRSQQTVVLDEDQAMEALAEDPRWIAANIVPAHYMCAPVALGGRYLGLLEIANPVDGVAFSAEDGHALTYMGQQLGEFLGQRDLILDPERITAPRLNARIRRG